MFNKIRNKVKKKQSEDIAESQEVEKNESASEDKKGKKSASKKSSELDQLKEQLEEKETELSELKDKYLRIFAEFDNYKKRTMKEKMDFMRNASQDVLADLLPVLDDFDRAKQSADSEDTDEVFPQGVTLVFNKLGNVMRSKGVVPMETNGEVFDAELHEAITKIPAPSEDMKGKIIDTITKGYYLNDKIIRHAKVVVGE
jgi:molecular chaperone GrpE